MTILLWILLGITAGWITSMVLKTHITQGFVTDLILGIVGAIFGGLLLSVLGQTRSEGLDFISLFVVSLGSLALIWFGRIMNAPAR